MKAPEKICYERSEIHGVFIAAQPWKYDNSVVKSDSNYITF